MEPQAFPVSLDERWGLQEMRQKRHALGLAENTRTDVTWTWHGDELHSVLVSHRTLKKPS